jgi:hypothetical protein
MANWQKKRNINRNGLRLVNQEDNDKWRGNAPLYRFGLFVLGRYIGEVTMLGDNDGHARTRFLDQVLDKRSEFVTLVPRRAKALARGVAHVNIS